MIHPFELMNPTSVVISGYSSKGGPSITDNSASDDPRTSRATSSGLRWCEASSRLATRLLTQVPPAPKQFGDDRNGIPPRCTLTGIADVLE